MADSAAPTRWMGCDRKRRIENPHAARERVLEAATRLDPRDGGKRHLTQTQSATSVWRSSKRHVPSPGGTEPRPTGVMKLPEPKRDDSPPPERAHFPVHNKPSTAEVHLGATMGRKMRPPEPGAKGEARQVDLERTLGRKRGVQDARNGIPTFNPGDKLYGTVECSPGFFKQQQHAGQTGAASADAEKALAVSMQFAWKRLGQQLHQEVRGVQELEEWESTTGFQLRPLKPKDMPPPAEHEAVERAAAERRETVQFAL